MTRWTPQSRYSSTALGLNYDRPSQNTGADRENIAVGGGAWFWIREKSQRRKAWAARKGLYRSIIVYIPGMDEKAKGTGRGDRSCDREGGFDPCILKSWNSFSFSIEIAWRSAFYGETVHAQTYCIFAKKHQMQDNINTGLNCPNIPHWSVC